MCFSAPASFIAGTALSAVGVATLTRVKKHKEIPLALIPLLFGIQQLTEGVVWVSLRYGMTTLNTISSYSFVFFAQVLWPIYVPIAVLLIETVKWRKRIIVACVGLGAVVSAYLLYLLIAFPLHSQIVFHSIQYVCDAAWHVPFSLHAVFYIIATCVSTLISSHKMVRWLGITTTVFLGVAYYFYSVTFASVWCFFAALLSVIIFFHFKK